MDERMKEIISYVDAHRDEMIALWKDLVNLEGSSKEKANLDLVAARIKEAMEEAGATVTMVEDGPVPAEAPITVLGVVGADRPGKPVVLSGHYDTVFPKGTFGENPFRIEGDKAYGPGVLDMKGGIVIAIYVVKALNAIGFKDRPIRLIFCGDEEIGHPKSTAGQLFQSESKGCACAFNLETGLVDNSLCVGRKTANNYTVEVTGVESHAGNDFESGRSAIAEACLKVTEIQALTDLSKGTTVNTGTIQGGTVPNAVPGYCKFVVNARFESYEEFDRVNAAVVEICNRNHIDGTHTTVQYHKKAFPIFECTPAVMGFWEFSSKIADRYGFEKLGHKKLGGGSDASGICFVGTPVICSYGVRGEHNHTDREYALVETLFERTKLISAIIKDLGEYENA